MRGVRIMKSVANFASKIDLQSGKNERPTFHTSLIIVIDHCTVTQVTASTLASLQSTFANSQELPRKMLAKPMINLFWITFFLVYSPAKMLETKMISIYYAVSIRWYSICIICSATASWTTSTCISSIKTVCIPHIVNLRLNFSDSKTSNSPSGIIPRFFLRGVKPFRGGQISKFFIKVGYLTYIL